MPSKLFTTAVSCVSQFTCKFVADQPLAMHSVELQLITGTHLVWRVPGVGDVFCRGRRRTNGITCSCRVHRSDQDRGSGHEC